MLHFILEFCPFISGILIGLITFAFSQQGKIRLKLLASVSLSVGFICALVAGELTGGFAKAVTCIAMDSGTAAAGWILGHFALRRVTA
jgi:hypothetical protein